MPTAAPPPLTRRRERLVVLVLAAVQFTSIVDFMVVMPLGPQLARDLDLTPARFGLIVSSYTYAAGLAGLLASVVLDRHARRPAFLALFAGFLAGTLACGLAPSYGWLLAARVLTGAFGGVLGGLAMAVVGDVVPEERRGAATGTLMSAFALASVAGVPAGLALGQRFGWHAPFLALAALGVPAFAAAAAALPRLGGHVAAGRPAFAPLAHLRSTFADPNHLRAFALTASMMFGSFTVVPFLAPYLVSNAGVPEGRLAVVYVAGGLVTLVGAPAAGRLADRYGKLRVYRALAPALCVVLVVATNLPPVPLGAAAAVVAALMLCNAGRVVPATAMVVSSVAPGRRGGFLGANAAVQHVAAGLGATAGGLVLEEAPDGTVAHYWVAGLLGVAATLLSLWLAGRLRPAGPGPAEAPAASLAAAAPGMSDASQLLPDTAQA